MSEMLCLFILGIVFIIFGAIAYVYDIGYYGVALLSLGSFVISVPIREGFRDNPKAIDVYRGNTTLQITYEDSVAVDTIVVFKKQ